MRENLAFCYKGNRNYVHGTDIFNAVYQFNQDKLNINPVQIEMSVHHVAHNNLILVVNENLKPSEKVAVNFYLITKGENIKIVLIESDSLIECSYEYSEDSIIEAALFDKVNKTITLPAYNHYSIIEKIVALNKGLLHNLFPSELGKWYFAKIKLSNFDFTDLNPYEIKLSFKKNMNFKLTQTEVLIDGKPIGSIYFSLVC